MPRFRRWVFNGITATLLVICAPVVWIISISGFVQPSGLAWVINSPDRREYSGYGIGLFHGKICFGSFHETWSPDLIAPTPPNGTTSEIVAARGLFFTGEIAIDDHTSNRMGFAIYDYHWGAGDGYASTHSGLEVPAYFASLVLCVPALVCAVRSIRSHGITRRRIARGLCAKCGYDLRATPGRCPECSAISDPNDGS
jgi:hypothetical protein